MKFHVGNARGALALSIFLGCAGLAAPAGAEVASATPGGFEVRESAEIALAPDAAYKRFLRVGDWWSSEHSFSGDAHNMHIDARVGGCWCETLPTGGGVRHMQLVYLAPGRTLRFVGGLGPLQGMAVSGVMTVTFASAPGGSKVSLSYSVGGYVADGLLALAPAVDGVLGAQLKSFAAVS